MTRERFFSRYYPATADACGPFAPLSLGYNNYRIRDAFPQGDHPPSHVSELCDETPIRASSSARPA